MLLGLFIILYAISNIDKEKYKNFASALGNYFGRESVIPAKPETKFVTGPKEDLSSELSKLIVENNYSNSIQLEESERGITVHILENLLFAAGKADLSPLAKTVLKSLAEVIIKLPNDIRVEGHTDDTPINTSRYPSNWHLSVDRALNTAYYLIKEEGLDPDKVSIVGYAEYKPVSPNQNPELRSKNRRVDLVILK